MAEKAAYQFFKFSEMHKCSRGLSYHDIDIITRYSDVLPHEVSTRTRITRNIYGNIPLLSAAMPDVTETAMAIKIGLLGGVGVIHKNNTPAEQADMVRQVKRYKQACIEDPEVLSPQHTIDHVIAIRDDPRKGYDTIPITRDGRPHGKLVGLIDRRTFSDQKHKGMDVPVKQRMIPLTDVLVKRYAEFSPDKVDELLLDGRSYELLLVDKKGNLCGMYTRTDINKNRAYPHACNDKKGRLIVAAAVGGPGNDLKERAAKLADAEVDIFCIDTSQGHSKGVGEMTLPYLKKNYPDIDVIAGNVDGAKGAEFLCRRGADAIKVGIGPSPICRTKRNIGGGTPQLTAIYEAARAASKYEMCEIPVIADGGIVEVAGDILKALAAGASSVMLGSLLAGTKEAPGKEIALKSRPGALFKEYKGMGTKRAQLEGSASRYFQEGMSADRIVSHGVVAAIPYKGYVEDQILHITDTLKDAMSKYYGCRSIDDIRKGDLEFTIVNRSPPAEPHGLVVMEEE